MPLPPIHHRWYTHSCAPHHRLLRDPGRDHEDRHLWFGCAERSWNVGVQDGSVYQASLGRTRKEGTSSRPSPYSRYYPHSGYTRSLYSPPPPLPPSRFLLLHRLGRGKKYESLPLLELELGSR
ncbi:hypothetical protein NMY22_g20042 [Coprinellus aureogranulatus]|nr:hypothetical protein NMY22_g20042 [Coprinellus aureogranulatus]